MNYGVFDIEAERWIRFKVLGFFDGTNYKTFSTVRAFLQGLDKKEYRGFRFYAHNGGKYDFLFIIEEMFKLGWKLRFIESGGRIIAIYVKTGKTEFHFADSYALLKDSLKNLGIAFNVEHPKAEYDFEDNSVLKVTPRLLKYLENDCYCLFEVLTKFFENEWIKKPQLTIASQALYTFRTFFTDSELYKVSLPYETLFRDRFYSGGRVEVYKGYCENGTMFDVNSLFPYAMLQEMPCGEIKHTTHYDKEKIGFYKVHIKNTPDWYISPLLIKGTKKNFFVNGEGEYFLSSATLNHLKSEYGIRFQIDYGLVFPKRKELFRDYVTKFYSMKEEFKRGKDRTQYMIAKYMLNTLYGKLGQMRFRESLEQYDGTQKNFKEFDSYFGLVLVENVSHSKFILPYLASYITELARLHHFQLMQIDPHSVYYCDTDSIFSDSKKFEKRVGTSLGSLSNEGTFKGVFLAPKCYALKDGRKEKIVFKGFKTANFNFKNFLDSQRKGLVLQEQRERILSFRECFKRKGGILESRGKFLNLVSTEKTVESPYDKRKLTANKKTFFDSVPFQFDEVKK